MMSLPVLYSFRRCPYAMRARLAIVATGQQVQLREVILKDKPQALLDCSAKATVPVLQLASGEVIDQSRDILWWAVNASQAKGWLPADRLAFDDWLNTNDGPFKTALDHYKYPNLYRADYPELSEAQIASSNRLQAEQFLQRIEQQLAQTPYLSGSQLGLTDIAILPFIRQFAFVDKAWFDDSSYPRLQHWLAQFLSSSLFAAVMPKFPQWREGDKPLVFP